MVGSGPRVAGGGVAAARAARRSKRSAPFDCMLPNNSPDDWYRTLKEHGLLEDPAPRPTVSAKYLAASFSKQRKAEASLINQTWKEHRNYERSAVARMAEATRWAEALGLRRRFSPVYVAEEPDKPDKFGLRPRARSPTASTQRGELRCEILSEEEHRRVVSCALFEREHAKLRAKHRQREADADLIRRGSLGLRSTASMHDLRAEDSLRHPKRCDSATSVALCRRGRARSPSPSFGRASAGVSESAPQCVAGGKQPPAAVALDRTEQLSQVLDETRRLTETLRAQVALLKENGWNLG